RTDGCTELLRLAQQPERTRSFQQRERRNIETEFAQLRDLAMGEHKGPAVLLPGDHCQYALHGHATVTPYSRIHSVSSISATSRSVAAELPSFASARTSRSSSTAATC